MAKGDRKARFQALLAGNQSSAEIQFQLGMCYLNGDGVEKNRDQAELWLSRAASQGHVAARERLQKLTASSVPTGAEPKKRERPAGKPGQKSAPAAEEKQPKTSAPAPDWTVPDLPPLAIPTLPDWCEQAEAGNPEVQYQVASFFRDRKIAGSEEDVERYFTLAAEAGHPRACLELARIRLSENRPGEAVSLLRTASDGGIPEASELLAECFAQGRGVDQNLEEAERLLTEAALATGGEGMLKLAVRYATGDSVPRSQGKAMSWLKQAQDAGAPDARNRFEAGCEETWIRKQKEQVERLHGMETGSAEETGPDDWHREQEQRLQEQERFQEEVARRKQQREEDRRRQEELEEQLRQEEEEKQARQTEQGSGFSRSRAAEENAASQPRGDAPGKTGGGRTGMVVCIAVLVVLLASAAVFFFRTTQSGGDRSSAGSGSSASRSDSSSTGSGSESPRPDPVEADPFQAVEVVFSGIAPFGRAEAVNRSEDAFLRSMEFEVEPAEGLSNGDEVTVTAVFDREKAAENGYEITPTEQSCTVSGLETYVDSTGAIRAEDMNQMKAQAIRAAGEQLEDVTAQEVLRVMGVSYSGTESLTFSRGVPVLAETQMMRLRSDGTEDSRNMLSMIFAVPLTVTTPSSVLLNEYGYCCVSFSNLTVDTAGSLNVDLTQARAESLRGTLDEVKEEFIRIYQDRYEIEEKGFSVPDLAPVTPPSQPPAAQDGAASEAPSS